MSSPTPSTTVHPRVCGEQVGARHDGTAPVGSSPRVRGTGRNLRRSVTFRRFIPACAGNSGGARGDGSRTAVHPRVCGEQGFGGEIAPVVDGSSPRVRGTASGTPPAPGGCRFIPACAGNRPTDRASPRGRPVHPRVCGEQVFQCRLSGLGAGSSPRVRGTGHFSLRVETRDRFIPACAGNSHSKQAQYAYKTVHPRVCGEQPSLVTEAVIAAGSSPRVRGTVGPPTYQRIGQRFIPACAGNRISEPRRGEASSVHPRVCGEQ